MVKNKIGLSLDSYVFYSTVIDFEGRFTMNHHNDTQFFLAGRAERFGKGFSTF